MGQLGNIPANAEVPQVGSSTAGNLVQIDASNNIQDAGLKTTDLIGTATNFYLHDDASDIGGGYLQAKTTPSTTAEVNLTGLTNLDVGTYLLNVFITNTGIPGKTELFAGIITAALKANKSAGSKNVQLQFTFFTRTVGGVETVHATSSLSDFVTPSNQRVFPQASQPNATIAETDRWGIKVYAVVSGGGSNVDINLQIEGSFNAYWKSPTVTGFVGNHAATHVNGDDDIQDATASQKGLMTSAYASKLDGIAAGATANSSDATLLDRANHTGTQDIDTTTTGTLPIGRGGSGQTTQQAAIDALTNVSAATNEHVLTKDTASGNAIWKAAASSIYVKASVNLTHASFTAAATSETINLFSLPAGAALKKIVMKTSTAFAGTGITAWTLEVGISGSTDKYATAFDVFQAVGDGVLLNASNDAMENWNAATQVTITARTTGGDLNASTAGVVDVYYIYEQVK